MFRWLDLRFSDKELEAQYCMSLRDDFLRSGFIIILILLAVIPVSIVRVIVLESSRKENPLGASFDVRMAVVVVWMLNFLLLLTYLAINLLCLFKGWFKQLNLELLFLCTVTIYVLSLAYGNFWTLPLLVGRDPNEVWHHDPRGTDVFILLAMDGLMTLVAMYIPIRACLLWILMVVAAGCYTINTIVMKSMFPDDFYLTVTAIISLAILAYHGAFRREITQRAKFKALQMVVEAEEAIKEQELIIQERTAAVKGLRLVAEALCDIILQVSSELKVHGPDRKRDAFFEDSMEGKDFLDFVHDEDRPRFKALIREANETNGPRCMPTTIKKNQMTSEVHLLLVNAGSREPRFFIGIRVEVDHYAPASYMGKASATQFGIDDSFTALMPGLRKHEVKDPTQSENTLSNFSIVRNANPHLPQFTPVKGRALCLVKLLPRWNVARDTESCCQYHTVLNSIEEAADYLRRRPCEPLWRTWGCAQCPKCKCMSSCASVRCAVCGHNPEEEEQKLTHNFHRPLTTDDLHEIEAVDIN